MLFRSIAFGMDPLSGNDPALEAAISIARGSPSTDRHTSSTSARVAAVSVSSAPALRAGALAAGAPTGLMDPGQNNYFSDRERIFVYPRESSNFISDCWVLFW